MTTSSIPYKFPYTYFRKVIKTPLIPYARTPSLSPLTPPIYQTSSPSRSKNPVKSLPFSVLSLHISPNGDELHSTPTPQPEPHLPNQVALLYSTYTSLVPKACLASADAEPPIPFHSTPTPSRPQPPESAPAASKPLARTSTPLSTFSGKDGDDATVPDLLYQCVSAA